jgi:hypothetical protein
MNVSGLWQLLNENNGAITAVATMVMAIFTIVLARVTGRQTRLTREALITTERAFVFLEDFETEHTYNVGLSQFERFVIMLRWKNNGTTPTKNMRIAVNWTHWMGDLSAGFDYRYGDERPRMFLSPQATEWSAAIEIPPHVANAASKGDGHIFIWGRVDYEDIFPSTQPHFTQWCYRVNISIIDNQVHPTRYVAFGDYNNSDEDSRTTRVPIWTCIFKRAG